MRLARAPAAAPIRALAPRAARLSRALPPRPAALALAAALSYEIMTPESVGADSALVLGKHSGKAAFKQRLQQVRAQPTAHSSAHRAY